MKKQIIISAILSVLYLPVTAASLEINGGRSYKYSPNELSTGLNMGVYVVSPIDNLTITFTSDSYESMQMYTFTSSGTSAKLPASGAQQTGNKIPLSGGARDCGYVIEQGGSIFLIDQHAAHERVLFEEFSDKFKNGGTLSALQGYYIILPGQSK